MGLRDGHFTFVNIYHLSQRHCNLLVLSFVVHCSITVDKVLEFCKIMCNIVLTFGHFSFCRTCSVISFPQTTGGVTYFIRMFVTGSHGH